MCADGDHRSRRMPHGFLIRTMHPYYLAIYEDTFSEKQHLSDRISALLTFSSS